MTDAERHELADRCDRIDRAGGSVREYLRSRGFISPWGTWHRLQKEQLGRTEYQITEGKGAEIMRKLTLEDKQKAVDVAISGGNPVAFLKEIGNANPSAAWYYIKKTLKAVDPEKFDQLMNRSQLIQDADGVRMRTADGDEFPITGQEKPEVKMTISSEELDRIEAPEIPVCTKPLTYDGFKSRCIEHDEWGKFYYDAKQDILYWTDKDGAEVVLSPKGWREFATEILPRAMAILGI